MPNPGNSRLVQHHFLQLTGVVPGIILVVRLQIVRLQRCLETSRDLAGALAFVFFLASFFLSCNHSSRHLLALPDLYVVFHSNVLCVTTTFSISHVSFLQILWKLVRYHNFRVVLFHNLPVLRF